MLQTAPFNGARIRRGRVRRLVGDLGQVLLGVSAALGLGLGLSATEMIVDLPLGNRPKSAAETVARAVVAEVGEEGVTAGGQIGSSSGPDGRSRTFSAIVMKTGCMPISMRTGRRSSRIFAKPAFL